MKKILFTLICTLTLIAANISASIAQNKNYTPLKDVFMHPPQSAKPWVYWYWMRSAVTRAGITADLEAMHKEGMGGAYLMTIYETTNPPFINPPLVPLTPEWWETIRFTINEARRLGVQLAMTPCDGWALAGGPWITPELSMQKVVWTKTEASEGKFDATLSQPESYKGFYKDIAVYAYPAPAGYGITTDHIIPKVTTSVNGRDASFLVKPGNKQNFKYADSCWIQLSFDQPFTCRSLIIRPKGHNYQAQRMIVECSNDGVHFKYLTRLEPPRHGWQNDDEDNTHTIPATTAKYFRLIYGPGGTEPGAEDIDYAKWKPEIDITGIQLSSEAKTYQFEGKNGSVWRVSKRSTNEQLPVDVCVAKDKLVNISDKMDAGGHLKWNVPAGKWIIMRMGHTSTGHKNAAAGTAGGLECDKFSVEAARIQFNGWFGEVIKQNGNDITKDVLKIFHVDSWECGSQNWSTTFAAEFKKRRGYDLLDYLPVMAGVPLQSADFSERILNDVRHTITELTTDNFFGTLQKLAHEKGCTFSAEAVAATMVSDDLLHFKNVDIPMGEFWYRSPTHDKPNDIFDAVSGGHIYGKNIIQAESFTELRLMWDEHPAMLKTMTDRNFAFGINRFVLHVNSHNPWADRKPGMTLDGVGLFFQHNQTWYKPGKAWIDYIQRCQALLQQGKPVADIAVFTGEEIPSRALLPDRLINTLPGLFGKERVAQEKIRMDNKGVPLRGVSGDTSVANMFVAEDWIDPLRGYTYDCINKDALIRLAHVHNGRIELPGGASYGVLVIPGPHQMSPNAGLMSPEVLKKLQHLVDDGATIILNNKPMKPVGMATEPDLAKMGNELYSGASKKGRVLTGPYQQETFDAIGLQRDFFATEAGKLAKNIAWTHRSGAGFDIYFIANQQANARDIKLSLRASGYAPELFDALTGETRAANNWQIKNARTELPIKLDANGSLFIILQKNTLVNHIANGKNSPTITVAKKLITPWQVSFDPEYGGPRAPLTFNTLYDWTNSTDKAVKYYSGTAVYRQSFNWQPGVKNETWLDLGKVDNIAQVYVNGADCGVAWTYPYRVNVTKALKPGKNELKIEVTNTWANRIKYDHILPAKDRITWTNAAYRQLDTKLLPAGLTGEIKLINLHY